MPKFADSTEKILGYITALQRPSVSVSDLFYRDYTCPEGCGGCCSRFTLDYMAESKRWEDFKKLYPDEVPKFYMRRVKDVLFFTNWQTGNFSNFCEYLDRENGRCKIHGANPFSCEIELIKFIDYKDRCVVIKKKYGRGWNMMRIDGKRGAVCEMLPFNEAKLPRDIELLEELLSIQNAMKLESHLKEVIQNIRSYNDSLFCR